MSRFHCYHVDNRYGLVWTPRKRTYNVYVILTQTSVTHIAIGVPHPTVATDRREVMGEITKFIDPNEALAELLDLARADQSEFNEDIHRMAELVLALHEFFSNGGFLPAAWVLARTRIVQDANYLPSQRRFADLDENEKQDVADGRPVPGYAMGRAIAEAEDRRSLAEAKAEGWPIVERSGTSAAEFGGE